MPSDRHPRCSKTYHPLAASDDHPTLENEMPMQSKSAPTMLLNRREAMAQLRIGKTTFYKLLRDNALDPAHVTEASVRALIARRGIVRTGGA